MVADKPEIILISDDGKKVFIGYKGLEIFGEPEEPVNGWYQRVDDGTRCHYKEGRFHHETEPAFILPNGRGNVWYKYNKIHRDNGLAVDLVTQFGDKRQCYFQNGLLHAEGKPASITTMAEGSVHTGYYQHGMLHRTDGPAYVVLEDGELYEQYLIHDVLHREDGPALINKNVRAWYQEGELHRLDGPAVVRSNGQELYYIQGLESDKKSVSKAFLENRGQTIGQAKKTDIVQGDAETKARVMAENIARWKREKEGAKTAAKPAAKLPSRGMR